MSTTPNMNLVLPTVGATVGPQWASQIVEAFETVDEHDHTAGRGARIVSNAINIDGDLPFNSHKAKSVELLTLVDLASFPTGSGDVRGVLSRNGDLFWNNGSGIAVQLTAGNRANVGPITGTNAFGFRSLSLGNLSIQTSDTFSYIDVTTSAPHIITLPAASAVTGGRYFIVKDATGNASTSSISIAPNGADTIEGSGNSNFIINGDFDCYAFISDGTGSYRTMHLFDGEFERGGIYRPVTGVRFQGLVTGEPLFNDPLRFGAATQAITASSQLTDPRAFANQVVHLVGSASADVTLTVPGQAGWSKTVFNQVSGTTAQRTTTLSLSGSSVVVPENAFATVWTSGSPGNVKLYGGFNSRTMPPLPSGSNAVWMKLDEGAGSTTFRNAGDYANWSTISGTIDAGYPGIQRLAVRFDGVNANLLGSTESPDTNPEGDNGFRLSAWIKPFWNNNNDKAIITKRHTNNAQPALSLGLCMSGSMTGALSGAFTTSDSGFVTKFMLSPVHVELGGWNHVGMSWSLADNTWRLWLNGANVVSRVLTGTFALDSTGQRFILGGNGVAPFNPFCGFVDDLRFEVSASGVGDPSTFANASRFFADAYRRGMGWFDDVGAYGA